MNTSRRTLLRLFGTAAGAGALGVAGTGVSAATDSGDGDEFRLLGDVAVPGATEVVARGNYAYVATGDDLAVIDWENTSRPAVVYRANVPGTGVNDVKVDGDLLAISSQGEHEHGEGDEGDSEDEDDGEDGPDAVIGTHFYDVSDPTEPRYLSTHEVLPEGVHNHFLYREEAYVCKEAPFDESELQIVDVSDPTDPTLLTRWAVEDDHPDLDQPTNFLHDVYVQDDLAYLAYWDAGTRVLDVSDPENPVEVAAFGEAPDADESVPLDFSNEGFARRILLPPGNAHYVQPSPDGDYVYVGAETFPLGFSPEADDDLTDDPDEGDFGGIKVYDTSDLDTPGLVTRIAPPVIDEELVTDEEENKNFTAHNFDIFGGTLYTSWYNGGVWEFDIRDPTNPTSTGSFDPEGSSFWTAVCDRGVTVASDIDSRIVFLQGGGEPE